MDVQGKAPQRLLLLLLATGRVKIPYPHLVHRNSRLGNNNLNQTVLCIQGLFRSLMQFS